MNSTFRCRFLGWELGVVWKLDLLGASGFTATLKLILFVCLALYDVFLDVFGGGLVVIFGASL